MKLNELGWNSFFQDHFKKYEENNLIPGRIFLIRKDQYLVYSESGELIAKISGKIHHDAQSKSEFPAVGDSGKVNKETLKKDIREKVEMEKG